MEIGSSQWTNIIRRGARALGVDVSSEQTDRFTLHARELIKWNQRVNLTAITDPYEIAVKHFVDSIAAAAIIPPHVSMLDIGSGGGFPGIPLKTLIPSLTVALVDASRKKVSFLKHICRALQLRKIEAHQIRGQDLTIGCEYQKIRIESPEAPLMGTTPVSPKPFDVVISRALASLTDFIAMAMPVLAEDGVIVAMGGKAAYAQIKSLHAYLSDGPAATSVRGDDLSITVKWYELPFLGAQRSLISIRLRS
jgi:16S rRNA (guanine527-N7)-methyltransferase